MGDELPREVAAILQRLTILSESDQLLAYETIRDYLAAGGRSALADAQLDERGEALRIMRAVMAHYGLTDPRKLRVKQFDAAPDELREEWRSGRVVRAWGTWKFARDALVGAKPRPTAAQRAVRSAYAGRKLQTDDYLAGVRAWLETAPPQKTMDAYTGWARERDSAISDGTLPYPRANTVRGGLGLGWLTILQVAGGELKLADATETKRAKRRAVVGASHDLVSSADIVEMSGRQTSTVQYFMHRADFPTPVLVLGTRRFYLREDIKAFLDETPVPDRERNELGDIYIDREAAAEILDCTPGSFNRLKGSPAPVARVGGINLWLKQEVEATAEAWKQTQPPGARRRRGQ